MRITAGSGIRKLNMKVPISQMKNSTDRKSVEGRQKILQVKNPSNPGVVMSGESHAISNFDSQSAGNNGATVTESRNQVLSGPNITMKGHQTSKSGAPIITATKASSSQNASALVQNQQ